MFYASSALSPACLVCLQYWETIMASGQNQVNIGAIFKGSSPQNFYPRAITVNGNPCYIQQLR